MVEYDDRPSRLMTDPGLHGLSARYRLYETADGWVFLAAPAPSEWDALVSAVAPYADLAADARFADEESRLAHDDALVELLSGMFRKQRAEEWEAELCAADVGCVALRDGAPDAQLFADGGLGRENGWITDIEHPTIGVHPRLMPLVGFSRSSTVVKPSALLGTHTDAVLAELGYDAERIASLRDAGAIL
jgi:crotonobetainyl-CoA:carnitine CoA-transferase CaiB-like acyl-CoA transferase